MNELAFITENPVAVLTSETKYSEFYARIKAEVSAFEPDVSTAKGRAEIKALAYKVTRSKTAIDAAGKQLNEDARKQINTVDASRRRIREELDALADEVRKPLTEWEDIEAARVAAVAAWFDKLAGIAVLAAFDGSNLIADRIAMVEAMEIDPAVFRDANEEAERSKAKVLAALSGSLETARQREADQAELARLRQEQEARERAERERVEADRREFERKQAEQLAKDRAEREAQERKAREDRIAEEARQAEARRAQEAIARAEAEARAVKERAEREEAARLAEIERVRRGEEKRAANRKHRARIMAEAAAAMVKIGAEEPVAEKIVLAIIAGEIPNISLRF